MSAREKLLNAAAKLAATDGVQALGVERVVQEAEVSKGAFFYHFETKEQMIGALLDHVASQRMAEVDAAVRSGRSFAGALVDMVESELLESGELVGVVVAGSSVVGSAGSTAAPVSGASGSSGSSGAGISTSPRARARNVAIWALVAGLSGQ